LWHAFDNVNENDISQLFARKPMRGGRADVARANNSNFVSLIHIDKSFLRSGHKIELTYCTDAVKERECIRLLSSATSRRFLVSLDSRLNGFIRHFRIATLEKRQQVEALQDMGLREKFASWLRGSRDAADRRAFEQNADDVIDPFNPFLEPVTIAITDTFDLHTISPREVRLVVEEYLSEAHRKGFRSVRLIHGKGIGVQREMVRSILGRIPFVTGFTDAPPEAGGRGATVAYLSTDPGS
jgi:hypothetical protein